MAATATMTTLIRNGTERLSSRRRLVGPKETVGPLVGSIPGKSGRPPSLAPDVDDGFVSDLEVRAHGALEESNENRETTAVSGAKKTLKVPKPGAAAKKVGAIVEEEDEDENCCVLCVGSTGTGKSSTIGKLTGQVVPSGSSLGRVTLRCNIYRPKLEMEKLILSGRKNVYFIDTVGWDDADADDEDTFRYILGFLDANNVLRIKAVIWFVLPNIRRDALLVKQAALINRLAPLSDAKNAGTGKNYAGSIWGRTIIACKQAMNPEQDTRGAVAAALDHDPFANIQVPDDHSDVYSC